MSKPKTTIVPASASDGTPAMKQHGTAADAQNRGSSLTTKRKVIQIAAAEKCWLVLCDDGEMFFSTT